MMGVAVVANGAVKHGMNVNAGNSRYPCLANRGCIGSASTLVMVSLSNKRMIWDKTRDWATMESLCSSIASTTLHVAGVYLIRMVIVCAHIVEICESHVKEENTPQHDFPRSPRLPRVLGSG
jgi:hypothetical protein